MTVNKYKRGTVGALLHDLAATIRYHMTAEPPQEEPIEVRLLSLYLTLEKDRARIIQLMKQVKGAPESYPGFAKIIEIEAKKEPGLFEALEPEPETKKDVSDVMFR